jgi:hypothetical protein
VLLPLLVLAVGLWTLTPLPVGLAWDDGGYVVLAKSLAAGDGLRYLNLPGAPLAPHYPPGYPALLAALWLVSPAFPGNVVVLKAANFVLLSAAAALAYRFAVRRVGVPWWGAALAVLAGTLTVPPLLLAGVLLSETLFLTVLLAALVLAEGVLERPTVRRALALGALCAAAALVRTLGVVPLPVVTLLLWHRGARREAAAFLGAAVGCVLPWQLWSAAHAGGFTPELAGSYGSYLGWFADGIREHGWRLVSETLARNTRDTVTLLQVHLAPGLPKVVKWLLLAAVVGAWAAGATRLARRAPVFAPVLALYLAIVLVWPYGVTRFVWGMWLLLALLFAAGVQAVAESVPRARWRVLRPALLVLAALATLGHGLHTVRGYCGRWWSGLWRAETERVVPMVRWIATRTEPDDVVLADYEPLVYLYTGRTALPDRELRAVHHVRAPSDAEQAGTIARMLAVYHADWVVVRQAGVAERLRPLTQPDIGVLEVMDALPDGGIAFRVLRSGGARRP